MTVQLYKKHAAEEAVERISEERNIVIYLNQLKVENNPIKRDALQRLLIAEVDKKARHDTGSRRLKDDATKRTYRRSYRRNRCYLSPEALYRQPQFFEELLQVPLIVISHGGSFL